MLPPSAVEEQEDPDMEVSEESVGGTDGSSEKPAEALGPAEPDAGEELDYQYLLLVDNIKLT